MVDEVIVLGWILGVTLWLLGAFAMWAIVHVGTRKKVFNTYEQEKIKNENIKECS